MTAVHGENRHAMAESNRSTARPIIPNKQEECHANAGGKERLGAIESRSGFSKTRRAVLLRVVVMEKRGCKNRSKVCDGKIDVLRRERKQHQRPRNRRSTVERERERRERERQARLSLTGLALPLSPFAAGAVTAFSVTSKTTF